MEKLQDSVGVYLFLELETMNERITLQRNRKQYEMIPFKMLKKH